ncbi:putative ubiquitin-like-specific protease 1B isoform X4 [Arachis ipaensis]|uniref:putative ubiquitin-like-specific protease 1B isoform X4 n=1 Tax=Arachis ipaensis TaxID=130454 RepID=UPI0007AF25CB|nr:putative ubiquitin-like-specific protease 1B isoform X4 [Arachis ipaensis]XP_025630111.1 putative ubiquitin-like-specific protease 1B isoform X4 [Arachis hypogaea]QHO21381.1 Ubiquitin-like-specific protease [Arachis hypogaea]
MGLISSSNNKRHQQCMNLNRMYPSPNSSDSRTLKRAKFQSTSMNSTPLRSSPTSTGSRVSRYPNAVLPLHREVHAPCRSKKFGLLNISGTQKEIGKGRGNDALHNKYRVYQQAKDSALACIRLFEKRKEAAQVDTAGRNKEVYVIEDDDEEGPSIVTEQSLKGDDMALTGMHDFDAKDVVGFLQQSTPLVSESINSNLNVVYAERTLDTLSLSPEHPKKEPLVELVSLKPFVPLTKEEEDEVARAFSADRKKVLVTHYKSNIEITGGTFQCLRRGGWLNDKVIDLYLVLLKERERRKAKNSLQCHFFSTFFYTKLISGKNGYDFNSVRRWTSQKKLGYIPHECDKIFVPIHRTSHWCLAVINQKEKKFQYLDSLRGTDTQVLEVLARYFVDEVKDKTGKDTDVSSWEKEFVKDHPKQLNCYDCGMFMIKYADFYSRNMRLCFGQGDMPYFRLRTAKEILRLEAD